MKISAGWGMENQRVCYENICRLGKSENTKQFEIPIYWHIDKKKAIC